MGGGRLQVVFFLLYKLHTSEKLEHFQRRVQNQSWKSPFILPSDSENRIQSKNGEAAFIPPLHAHLGSLGAAALRSSDVEDGADAQEEAPEDGSQLGDQVELHHLTQVVVVARSVGLKLQEKHFEQHNQGL